MGWKNFSKKYKSRLANDEPAGTIIAEEYDKVIKTGLSLLGGKFIAGNVNGLKSALTTSFDSMGAIPLPMALTQGLMAYWVGTYVYLPPLIPGPIVPGIVPPMPLPIPAKLEFIDVLITLVFIPHLFTVNTIMTVPGPPPIPIPDIGYIVKK